MIFASCLGGEGVGGYGLREGGGVDTTDLAIFRPLEINRVVYLTIFLKIITNVRFNDYFSYLH